MPILIPEPRDVDPPKPGPDGRWAGLRTARGVLRSLWIYYGHRRRARMDRFYRSFLGPGDLAFDIGSHVGDRIGSFRRLGARVLALEPQPALARTLRWLYGRDPLVRIEVAAVGRVSGEAILHLNRTNPTVSTLSASFIAAAQGKPGWQGQSWDDRLRVRQVTLDDLIAGHGLPRFIKIDVEGFEAEVLGGLSQPPAALSFEFTTIQKEVARACLDACDRLGFTSFNAVLGEDHRFVLTSWVDAHTIGQWLTALPPAANSGDIYARAPRSASATQGQEAS
ncbi:methyltransferase FkbM [Thiocapsa imhoffii]|uniref:Methyltransferase FkbM n=1 Tax=Thiocapsa imhoffii TaxID=382777 RepID=A0A9X0WKD8_9GAMM|nr:FkbM family methyltransferase [Thiocapsa imhoffii]MBK1645772.1 methyltransferase FkbM [Thiocapsa imhoffii]